MNGLQACTSTSIVKFNPLTLTLLIQSVLADKHERSEFEFKKDLYLRAFKLLIGLRQGQKRF